LIKFKKENFNGKQSDVFRLPEGDFIIRKIGDKFEIYTNNNKYLTQKYRLESAVAVIMILRKTFVNDYTVAVPDNILEMLIDDTTMKPEKIRYFLEESTITGADIEDSGIITYKEMKAYINKLKEVNMLGKKKKEEIKLPEETPPEAETLDPLSSSPWTKTEETPADETLQQPKQKARSKAKQKPKKEAVIKNIRTVRTMFYLETSGKNYLLFPKKSLDLWSKDSITEGQPKAVLEVLAKLPDFIFIDKSGKSVLSVRKGTRFRASNFSGLFDLEEF